MCLDRGSKIHDATHSPGKGGRKALEFRIFLRRLGRAGGIDAERLFQRCADQVAEGLRENSGLAAKLRTLARAVGNSGFRASFLKLLATEFATFG